MRMSKDYSFRAFYSMGVSHHHLHLAQTQKHGEEWASCIVRKKGEMLGMPGSGTD